MEPITVTIDTGTIVEFQSPISGVNDWNILVLADVIRPGSGFSLLLAELMIGTQTSFRARPRKSTRFSLLLAELMIGTTMALTNISPTCARFSLLLAELMIGTLLRQVVPGALYYPFQSPISGVNDWNPRKNLLPISE